MKRHLTPLITLAMLWLRVAAQASGDEITAEARNIDERLAAIQLSATRWNAVERWLIENEAGPVPPTTGPKVSRRMAVAAPGNLHHLSAHFTPTQPPELDPFAQELFITAGRIVHRWPFNRLESHGSLAPGNAIGGSIGSDFLVAVIPRWPLSLYRPLVDTATKTPIVPADALADPRYRLLDRTDTIAGEACSILERDSIDRIWLAQGKGVCVMRRELRDAERGRLIQRIEATRLGEVAPGMWLPLEFKSQFFTVDEAGDEVPERQYSIRILKCEIDSAVPDSEFEPGLPAGTLLAVDGKLPEQISPGGQDLLDQIVRFMKECAGLPSQGTPHEKLWPWFVAGLFAGLLICTVLERLFL